MRHKNLTLSTTLLVVLGLTELQAQESVNATGGNATGGGGTVAYSVGQVVYTTNTGTNGTIVQGVQQTFEISPMPNELYMINMDSKTDKTIKTK